MVFLGGPDSSLVQRVRVLRRHGEEDHHASSTRRAAAAWRVQSRSSTRASRRARSGSSPSAAESRPSVVSPVRESLQHGVAQRAAPAARAQTLAARPWARPTRTRSSRRMSLILRPCGSSAKIWARPRPRRLTACLSLHRPRRLKTIRHICRWRCGAALCCVLGIHLLHVQCGFVAFFRWYWRVSPGPRNVHLRTQGMLERSHRLTPAVARGVNTQCI